jgi:hypothetical protein
MVLTPDQITELKEIIHTSLTSLYHEDEFLIDVRANERSIAFRFGLYFMESIADSSFASDNELSIDFDYNRKELGTKLMTGFSSTHGIFPDIILHKRNSAEKNVVVIEFKGRWSNNNRARSRDFLKLQGFTDQESNGYSYGLGVFVDIGRTLEECSYTYFINGHQQE